MAIATNTFLQDTVLFIRDTLRNNLTDPLSTNRPSGEQYVMTSYPRRAVQYPIITVKTINMATKKLGMSSEMSQVNMDVEVRAWARNMKEKDDMTQDILNHLRGIRLDAVNGSADNKLFNFDLSSCVNVIEDGENGIKSSVMTFKYYAIIGE